MHQPSTLRDLDPSKWFYTGFSMTTLKFLIILPISFTERDPLPALVEGQKISLFFTLQVGFKQ